MLVYLSFSSSWACLQAYAIRLILNGSSQSTNTFTELLTSSEELHESQKPTVSLYKDCVVAVYSPNTWANETRLTELKRQH